MYFILMCALFFGILAGADFSNAAPDEAFLQAQKGDKTVARYDAFVWASQAFVTNNAAVTGTYRWSTLKTQVSSNLSGAAIPNEWFTVVYAPGKYIACTGLTEPEITAIKRRGAVSDSAFFEKNATLLATAATASEAQAEAARCTPTNPGSNPG